MGATGEPKNGEPNDVVMVPKFLLVTIETLDDVRKTAYVANPMIINKITTKYLFKIKN